MKNKLEARIYFTDEELDALDEYAGMNPIDKLKLISQARHAIHCEKFAQLLAARIIKAVGVLGGDDEDQVNYDIKSMIGEIHEGK